MTFGFNIIINGQEPRRLEEFSEELQDKIRKASYFQLVQALGYKKEESAITCGTYYSTTTGRSYDT